MNRETWLNDAALHMGPMFTALDKTIPAKLRVSVGFPSTGALSTRRQTVGQCFYDKASADGNFEIFISPVIGDGLRALDILVHELAHAVLPAGVKHGPPFARLAKLLGLDGKPTATTASDGLRARLVTIQEAIGDYPHATLTPLIQVKRQVNRMDKFTCPDCGYLARVSKKWIAVGAPLCPAHNVPLVGEEQEEK